MQETQFVFMNPQGTELIVIGRSMQFWIPVKQTAYLISFKRYVQMLEQENWTCIGTL